MWKSSSHKMELFKLSSYSLSVENQFLPHMSWNSKDVYREWRRFKLHVESWWEGPMYNKHAREKLGFLKTWIGDKGRELFEYFRHGGIDLEDPFSVLKEFEDFLFHIDCESPAFCELLQANSTGGKSQKNVYDFFEKCKKNSDSVEESIFDFGSTSNVDGVRSNNRYNKTYHSFCSSCQTYQDTKSFPDLSHLSLNENSGLEENSIENFGLSDSRDSVLSAMDSGIDGEIPGRDEVCQLLSTDVDVGGSNEETEMKGSSGYDTDWEREMEMNGTEEGQHSVQESCNNRETVSSFDFWQNSVQESSNNREIVASFGLRQHSVQEWCNNREIVGSFGLRGENINVHSERPMPHGQSAQFIDSSLEQAPVGQGSQSAAGSGLGFANPSDSSAGASANIAAAAAASRDPPQDNAPAYEVPKQITDDTVVNKWPKVILDLLGSEIGPHCCIKIEDFMTVNRFNIGEITKWSSKSMSDLFTTHKAFCDYSISKLKNNLRELKLDHLIPVIERYIEAHNTSNR